MASEMENAIISNITFDLGRDGMPYAVWAGCCPYAWEYSDLIFMENERIGVIANWNGYENACLLQRTIGM